MNRVIEHSINRNSKKLKCEFSFFKTQVAEMIKGQNEGSISKEVAELLNIFIITNALVNYDVFSRNHKVDNYSYLKFYLAFLISFLFPIGRKY